jgi:IS1 transposase
LGIKQAIRPIGQRHNNIAGSTGTKKHARSALVKLYGNDAESEVRYSPAECIGTRVIPIIGQPDPKHISTSYVERQNLTMRMRMRRFTRLTNAFSKKVENHGWAVALYFMHNNFCRIHQTLRVTPAMEAGVSDHVWTLGELVSLLEHNSDEVAA